MRNAILPAAIVALAGQMLAGGFFLQVGNPEASPEAKKWNAVATFQVAGCHDPAEAKVTATAIGMANGVRREIGLKLDPLSKPGMYALSQQWPKEGQWVIRVEARNGEMYTSSLLRANANGVDRYHNRSEHREFTTAEIDEMLRP